VLVTVGYDPQRARSICANVQLYCTAPSWRRVLGGVVIVWNNAPRLWWAAAPCRAAVRYPLGNVTLPAEQLTPTTTPSCPPSVVFATDAMDNHYVIPTALGLPARAAVLIADDDVSLKGHEAFVSCLQATWRHDRHRVIAPTRGMRATSTDALGRRRMILPSGLARGPHFCAALPQLLLTSVATFQAYTQIAAQANLSALVRAYPICDDVAFSAAVHHHARRVATRMPKSASAAASPSGVAAATPPSPCVSPFVGLVAAMSPPSHRAPAGSGLGLSDASGHFERRDSCWPAVRAAMTRRYPEYASTPLWCPSRDQATCDPPQHGREYEARLVSVGKADAPSEASHCQLAQRGKQAIKCDVEQICRY
jgi:hypothetical protein